jgi:hypothetical protein
MELSKNQWMVFEMNRIYKCLDEPSEPAAVLGLFSLMRHREHYARVVNISATPENPRPHLTLIDPR